jgi:hypothetical protein
MKLNKIITTNFKNLKSTKKTQKNKKNKCMEKKPHPQMLLIVTKRKAPNFKPAKCKGRKRGGGGITSLNNRKGGHRSNNVKGHMTNIWKNKY